MINDDYLELIDELQSDKSAQQTEIERLRAALKAIRDSNPPLPSERNKSYYWMSRSNHYQEIARAALESEAD